MLLKTREAVEGDPAAGGSPISPGLEGCPPGPFADPIEQDLAIVTGGAPVITCHPPGGGHTIGTTFRGLDERSFVSVSGQYATHTTGLRRWGPSLGSPKRPRRQGKHGRRRDPDKNGPRSHPLFVILSFPSANTGTIDRQPEPAPGKQPE